MNKLQSAICEVLTVDRQHLHHIYTQDYSIFEFYTLTPSIWSSSL